MNGQLQLSPSLLCLIALYLPSPTYMRLWDVDDVIKFMPLLLHEVAESGTFRGKSLESLRKLATRKIGMAALLCLS